MSRITIEKRICIEPKFLNTKIREHLLEKIRKEFLEKCDQTYGYITKIFDKIKIVENIISTADIGVFFRVKFDALVFKPEVGTEYKGEVCMISLHGIFVEVFEKMKVLIPTAKMGSYKFDKSETNFKKGKKTISIKDTVTISIDMIRYEKQNFSCIGSLKIL